MKKLTMEQSMKRLAKKINSDTKRFEQYLKNATPEQKQKFKEQLDQYGYSDIIGGK